MNCVSCGVECTEENTYQSALERGIFKCSECMRETSKQWHKDNYERKMLKNAKERANRKGIDFELEESDIEIPYLCPLLGIKLREVKDLQGQADNSPSLDRIDNSLGYVKGNVWVVSALANRIMTNATPEQIMMVAEGLAKKLDSMVDKRQMELL